MKLLEMKVQVYELAGVSNTQELKKRYHGETAGRDLRLRWQWRQLLNVFEHLVLSKILSTIGEAIDEDKNDEKLKKSFIDVCRITGWNDEKAEIEWKRMSLELQERSFEDLAALVDISL